MCIYPTAPFVTSEKLSAAIRKIQEENALAVMSVVAFSNPPQRGYVIENERLKMKWKENFSKRSQDLEKIYYDCGQFYIMQVENYRKQNGQIVEGIVPLVVNEMEVQDIDDETDWKLAEIKYQMLNGKYDISSGAEEL